MKLSDKQLYSITSYLADKPVIRAYVFGSYARGDADDQSDIDLMVELDYSKSIGLKFFAMQNQLEELLDSKVDLITTESVSPYIKPYIEDEKELIYEK